MLADSAEGLTPERRIDSFVAPRGCLTMPGMPGMPGHDARHEAEWAGIERAMRGSDT